MTSVRLENLSKRFGPTVALDDVNLRVDAGELFFLLGPSGCGKTTLLRLVAGLQDPTAGKIFFNDTDVTALPTENRNAVMCFQSYALWPHMTVRENLRFGLDVRQIPRGEQDRRIDDVLSLVRMTEQSDRKANQLSGGQQQRVALARALVVRPNCLLLDEPLSNLDAKLRLEMRTEIRRICRSAHLTAIYVTHDQKEALSIADRMAILNAGKIEQIGNPQEIYLSPKNRFIANFMGETNIIDGTIVSAAAPRILIDTPLGKITALADGKPGDRVILSIRPEVLHLGDAPPGAPNRFDAAVHDTNYLGEMAQHQVKVGPLDLKAFELNPRFVARDETVQQATLWFTPENVVVIRE